MPTPRCPVDQAVATRLARQLLATHGLHSWQIRWTTATRAFGVCHHTRATIDVSWPITARNSLDAFTDTMLHEIAHARVGAGGHGADWQRECRRLGIAPTRCYGPEIDVPPPRWIGTCHTCGLTVHRQQLRTSARTATCPRCDTVHNPAFPITWTRPHPTSATT